jgi:hypothetical protein
MDIMDHELSSKTTTDRSRTRCVSCEQRRASAVGSWVCKQLQTRNELTLSRSDESDIESRVLDIPVRDANISALLQRPRLQGP